VARQLIAGSGTCHTTTPAWRPNDEGPDPLTHVRRVESFAKPYVPTGVGLRGL
jgi:hypothetical protein